MKQATESKLSTVYIIVVTYNGSAWITDCLQSLVNSIHPVEVVVVDNASTDDTAALVSQFTTVAWLAQEKNLGFGPANNVGIRHALDLGADYVFLLNQDARIHPDAVSQLVSCIQKYPEFDILSPIHLDGLGEQLDYLFSRHLARASNPSFTEMLSDLYRGTLTDVYPISFVNAAGWLISRRCLQTVGGFDPLFFMYGEDDDFLNRAVYHGFKIGVVPEAVLMHDRGKGTAVKRSLLAKWNGESKRKANEMMHTLTDLRRSFFYCILSWQKTMLTESLTNLLDLKFRSLGPLFWAGWILAFHLPAIGYHRRINRQPGMHWI